MAAMDPPIAAALPNFRCLVIAPPKKSSRLASSLLGKTRSCGNPDMGAPTPFSRYNIKAVAPSKRALMRSWRFRRSVAGLQHVQPSY
jgi:hypothetical protein